ncbi:hypothetical protein GPECTOR_36g92 [Gonium pectorale]|uniref:Cytochrome b561 domain-containing protein n=1 Tax=Gonium pectorale TaxID=33097 RepID=A0A150GBZ1_GONPE|nr:hypothetical protein GPECTOR_36g92 [Gonium pectorale]|eukprot:KXZ47371.1 hypothetical protein GPECTOR_36g92 [Gonium pectorale]
MTGSEDVILALLILIGHWVHVTLGGVALAPVELPDGTGNDTSKLFNWHPVLMTLAFAVLMAEGLLAYQSPLLPGLTREVRKRVHWGCHSAALLCAGLGLLAALQSHRLKRPVPMPDWYSPHSFLGLTALAAVAAQFFLGAYAYLWPRLGLPQRLALGPVHRFVGMTAWVAGLAAVATGVQEKLTFLQLGRKMAGPDLYGPAVRVPAAVLPLLVALAALVLYHQAPPAARLAGAAASDGSSGGGPRDSSTTQALLRGGAAAVPEGDEDADEEARARHRAY